MRTCRRPGCPTAVHLPQGLYVRIAIHYEAPWTLEFPCLPLAPILDRAHQHGLNAHKLDRLPRRRSPPCQQGGITKNCISARRALTQCMSLRGVPH